MLQKSLQPLKKEKKEENAIFGGKMDYWKTIMPIYSKGTPGCIILNENLNILNNINLKIPSKSNSKENKHQY